MNVALSLPRRGYANEARFGTQLIDSASPEVAHPCAQAAYKLVNVVRQRSSVRNLPFDPFRNQLRLLDVCLTVPVPAAVTHRAQRSHPAINLIRPSLIEDGFARALLRSREQTSDHNRMSSGGESLGDVAGEFDAAVRDDGDLAPPRDAGTARDRRKLRHSDARDHPCSTDGPGTDSDLDRVDSRFD